MICLKMVSQAYRHRSVADLPRRQRMQHNISMMPGLFNLIITAPIDGIILLYSNIAIVLH